MGAMHGASWIPLAWLAVLELREHVRWRWMAALALALAMTILAGLPQVAVPAFGSAILVALLSRRARHEGEAPLLPAGARLLAVWALLLAAIQIIPTFELTRNSVAQFRADWLHSGGGVRLGALYTLILPNYWGAFDMSKFHRRCLGTRRSLYLYCGPLGTSTPAAGCGLHLEAGNRLTGNPGIFTLLAAVWMLGDSTPIGRTIFLALPVNIRIGIHPEYTLPVFALGVAVLAGLGANRFPCPRVGSWRRAPSSRST